MDIYEKITNDIIVTLEAGIVPWHKPWASDGQQASIDIPHNASSGRAYSGINILILMMRRAACGYSSNGWLTYKQAQALGGQVRKGEKGEGIVYWQVKEQEDDAGNVQKRMIMRMFTVFNAEQCDGLEGSTFAPEPIEAGDICQRLQQAGCRISLGHAGASYHPLHDSIAMPAPSAFESVEHFDSTLLHEATHWTGHRSRLARDLMNRFGDDAYAAEELIAEMGSAFLCAQLGVPMTGLQHSDYIGHWLGVLRADKRAIFTAATAAQKACAYLLDLAWNSVSEVSEAA
jgi:antirestriction protein ArdC